MPHPAPLIGTDPTFTVDRRYRLAATDNAQIRIRRVLALLEAAHGACIHDLTAVIDSEGDEDVRRMAEDVQGHIGRAIEDAQIGLQYAVSACGGREIHETRPVTAAAE